MAAEFDARAYERKNGKRPRGVRTWAFTPANAIWPDRASMPADAIAWVWGSYADAKREVCRLHPDVDRWLVL